MTVSNERKGRRHNSLRFSIVTTAEQWVHACAVRSICFLDEHGAQAKWLFDGNDYQCTHVLAYDDEPVGTGRIRWFKDFAKIERTSFRKEHRDVRTLKEFAEFGFEHIRRKGYTRVITHAGPKYARLWKQILGFRDADGKQPALFEGHEPYYKIHKDLEPSAHAITTEAEAHVLFRIEGHWDEPAPFEVSSRGGAWHDRCDRDQSRLADFMRRDRRASPRCMQQTACGDRQRASEPPPLDLGEALEDAANKYLDLFEEISARYRKACQRVVSGTAYLTLLSSAADRRG